MITGDASFRCAGYDGKAEERTAEGKILHQTSELPAELEANKQTYMVKTAGDPHLCS